MSGRDNSHTAGAANAAAVAFQSLSAAIEAAGHTERTRTPELMIADANARKHDFIAALAMLASSLQELESADEYEVLTSIVAECRMALTHFLVTYS